MKSVLDEEQIAVVIQKLLCYKRMEDINFDSINTCFSNVGSYYKTKNSSKLDDIERQLSENMKRRSEYSNINIMVYDKNLEKYIATARDISADFKNIRGVL